MVAVSFCCAAVTAAVDNQRFWAVDWHFGWLCGEKVEKVEKAV